MSSSDSAPQHSITSNVYIRTFRFTKVGVSPERRRTNLIGRFSACVLCLISVTRNSQLARDGKNLTGQVFSILVLSSTETAIERDGLVKLAEKEPFQTRTLTC